MKLVTAIIKPFKLDDVRKAVSDVGVQGVAGIPRSIEALSTPSSSYRRQR